MAVTATATGARFVRPVAESKDWEVHEAMTAFTLYSYNFCWPVRTLRLEVGEHQYQQRTPAIAAGLTDHIWTIREWVTYLAVTQIRGTP